MNRNPFSGNDNSSNLGVVDIDHVSPRSDPPASIEQLVMGAEDLVIMRRRRRPSRDKYLKNIFEVNSGFANDVMILMKY